MIRNLNLCSCCYYVVFSCRTSGIVILSLKWDLNVFQRTYVTDLTTRKVGVAPKTNTPYLNEIIKSIEGLDGGHVGGIKQFITSCIRTESISPRRNILLFYTSNMHDRRDVTRRPSRGHFRVRLVPLFQSESWCIAFPMKNEFYFSSLIFIRKPRF